MRILVVTLIVLCSFRVFGQFEGNVSPSYSDLVQFYDSLAKKHKGVELYAMGDSDAGIPIYLCILNGAEDSLKSFQLAKKRTTIFINNGIHPGEPDGINACGQITLDFVKKSFSIDPDVLVAFVLNYNVGGALNRGSHSRANQEGPEEYGFRGNAQNLDLNRDFIKMDSKNAFTFARIFHALNPAVFIDTHVSNGADYQYVLTLIHATKERLAPSIQELTYDLFVPNLKELLLQRSIPTVPYVELQGETPESGIEAFNDLPRYAMGYASLFHCLSITTETHMLKPFEKRVHATKAYLEEVIHWTASHQREIRIARQKAVEWDAKRNVFQYDYQRTEDKDSLLFLGYEAKYKKSEVTGLDRLYYDRSKPYEKFIPYYATFESMKSVSIPTFYVIGSQCEDVLERLKANQVACIFLERDTVLQVECMRITAFLPAKKPYEGHFYHQEVSSAKEQITLRFRKGDVLVPTQQAKRNFILSVLEPEAEDSYFRWNFMDSYLQQKEYFSSYVFEEKALEILAENPSLKKEFEEKKASDPQFSANAWAQLYFIYSKSQYMEPTYMRLPIYRIF